MPDASQVLKILLQVQADVADLQGKLNPALDETKRKLNEAGDAGADLNGALAGLVGGLVAGGLGAAVQVIAAIPDLIAQAGEEVVRLAEEQRQVTAEVEKQVSRYVQLAQVASNVGDVRKLEAQIGQGLDAAAGKFQEFRNKELGLWETFKNGLTTIPFLSPEGTLKPALDSIKAATEQNLRAQLSAFNGLREVANQSIETFDRIRTEPVAQGIAEVNAKIATMKSELASLSEQAVPPIHATGEELLRAKDAAQEFINKSAGLETWEKLLKVLQGETQKLRDALFHAADAVQDVQSKIRSNLAEAAGNTAGVLDERLSQLRKEAFNQLFTGNNAVEAARMAEQLVDSERRKVQYQEQSRAVTSGSRDAARGEAAARRDIVAFLTEENALLQKNRLEQQLVEQNPQLSLDQKNSKMAGLMTQEIAQLNAKIAEGKAKIAGTVLDPATLARANAAIATTEGRVALLGQRLQTTGFTGQFRASLVAWMNSLGTTAQQIAGLITNTLGSAINGVSGAITGLIFHTQSLGQAALQMGQQFVQSLINVGLQMVAQKLLGTALTAATTTEQVSAGATIAAANAPAAAATAIASYGSSAVIGTIAAAAAIAAIIAAIAGGFESGGYTGGREGQPAGVVHGEEFVMSAPAVRRIGVANLEAMHSNLSRPGYASGGFVGRAASGGGKSGGPQVGETHIFNFIDMRQLQKAFEKSSATKKLIVNVVQAAGGRLRT